MITHQQKRAIESTAKRILVRAGAGTGKTEVLTMRVLHLLQQDPTLSIRQMAIVTFTNQATHELVTRLQDHLHLKLRMESQRDAKERWRYELECLNQAPISTLHKFCRTILDLAGPFRVQNAGDTIEYAPGFPVRKGVLYEACLTVINRWLRQKEKMSPVRQVMPIHEWSEQLFQLYYSIRSKGIPLNTALEKGQEEALFETGHVRTITLDLLYLLRELDEEYRRRKVFQLDMDDLLKYACTALQEMPELVLRVQERFRHIFVDEFQDTSLLQARLLRLICDKSEQSPALFVVGDQKQSIYAFRGADLDAYSKMERWIKKNGEVLPLLVNFRSKSELVEYVNQTFRLMEIDENKPEFKSEDLKPCETVDLEQQNVVDYVEVDASIPLGPVAPLLEKLNVLRKNGVIWNDMAVLFRTNHTLTQYAEAIKKHGLPVRVIGVGTLYQCKEIVTVYRFLQALLKPEDPICWNEALETDIIHGRSEYLAEMIAELRPFIKQYTISQILEELYRHPKAGLRKYYEDRHDVQALANLELLKEKVRAGYAEERTQLVDYVHILGLKLMTNPDEPQAEIPVDNMDAITFLTVHSAKGLEYKHVCLMELYRNLSARSLQPKLFYSVESGLEFSFHQYGGSTTVTTNRYDEQVQKLTQTLLQEEARILYVAMTRAKEKLYLFRDCQNQTKGHTYQKWLLQ